MAFAGPLLAAPFLGSKTTGKIGNALFGRPSRSDPVVGQPLLNGPEVGQIISRIMGMTQQGGQQFGQVPTGIQQSPFFGQYQSALSNPYQPTEPENQLLKNIMGQTSAGFALRGLGGSPVEASATAASIAPSLINLRQNQVGNLAQAVGQGLQGQQLQLGQREQDIGAYFAKLQGLLSFLGFGQQQPLGQQSRGGSPGALPMPLFNPLSFSFGGGKPSTTGF